MLVTVNDKEIEIFSGARVKNALLKYSQKEYEAVQNGEKKVVDKNGNPLDLDGELCEDSKLYIRDNT